MLTDFLFLWKKSNKLSHFHFDNNTETFKLIKLNIKKKTKKKMLDLLACSIYKKNPHCSPCERHYPPRPTVSRCFCLTAHNLPYISFAAVRQLNNCRNERAEIKHFAPKIKQKLN